MRVAATVFAVLALGCGRDGFDPRVDAAGSVAAIDAAPDAQVQMLAPGVVSKLTVSAPLLDSPSPTGGDCGEYAILAGFDDTMAGDDLLPYAALANDGATLWFAYSCKSADLGWSETLGSWVPPAGTFQRYDGDGATPMYDAFIGSGAMMPDGMTAGSVRQLRFAFGADDKAYGIGYVQRTMGDTMPVLFDQPLDLSPTSYDFAAANTLDPVGEPWAIQTGTGRDILRVDSTFYVYTTTWDGVTKTALGQPLTAIAVATTPDMIAMTYPAEPMVTGWSDPMVSAWGGAYHMIARDLSTNSFSYIRGSAPDSFDFAHPVPLGLAAFAGAPGAWDNLYFATHGTSADPAVSTARVVDGVMYMFYAAGVPPNAGAVESSGGSDKRGLGVLMFKVPG